MDGWMDGRMDRWMRMNEWMNEWLTDWMNEWMNEWTNELMNQWNCPTSSYSKSAPNGSDFFRFLCEIKLRLLSRADFANLIFQKCSKHVMIYEFCVKSSFGYSPVRVCTFCRQLAQIEVRNRETETLLRRPRKPLFPKKNTGFRARESCQAWSSAPDLLHFSTTWCWCGWHDDVVDMMVRMLPMTSIRDSEVF